MPLRPLRTSQEAIKHDLEDLQMFGRTCNFPGFATVLNSLSGYLEEERLDKDITQEEYESTRASIRSELVKLNDNCECKIKGLDRSRTT